MITEDKINGKQQSLNNQSEVADPIFLELEKLLEELLSYSQKQFTGRLTIKTPQRHQWQLYFGMGRLLWASGGEHPRRRWRRQLAYVSEQNSLTGHYSEGHLREGDQYECWNFHLLLALHKRKILSADQVREVMKGVIAEVLFDLYRQGIALCTSEDAYPNAPNHCGQQVFTRQWQTGIRPSQQMVVPPSWGGETNALLKTAAQSWSQWRDAGLTHVSPDQAPQLVNLKQLAAQTSEKVYANLAKLVTGDRSLRDLSVVMKMEPLKIARSLQPYMRENLMTLVKIADLPPSPSFQTEAEVAKKQLQRRADDQQQSTQSISPVPTTPAKVRRPLIAFVDDSEQSRQIMNNIVTKGGYDFIGIGDSVQAITVLLEKQPQLIFLDLMMPNVNGYELCSQIRKISVLKTVPIVIVTGNDGIIDRMRAKVVGASNFIAKPIDRSEVLTLALQYTQSFSQK